MIAQLNVIITFIITLVFHFFDIYYSFFYSKSVESSAFDFIIVGGGAAGLYLSLRLTEDPNISVLLLEAGSIKPSLFNIPALTPLMQQSPYDWKYVTVPQTNACLGLNENRSTWPCGKTLGGTTHLNYMIHLPGFINDFQSWKEPNTTNWDSFDVQYYMTKSQKKLTLNAASYTPQSNIIFEAVRELGYQTNFLNLKDSAGFINPLLHLNHDGGRWTFDQANIHRNNLKIITNAQARKIILNEKKITRGVLYEKYGKLFTVYCTHSVILSAGTIGSAHILMSSGIGPANVLKSSKVPVVVDLPVGKNLQDHVSTMIDIILHSPPAFTIWDLLSPISLLKYLFHGTGPYTTNGVIATGRLSSADENIPSLQLMFLIAGLTSFDYGLWVKSSLGINENLWEEYSKPLIGKNVITALPIVLHPKSTGELTLDLRNPYNPPLINPRYFHDTRDIDTLIKGIEILKKLMDTQVFKHMKAEVYTKKITPCKMFKENSKDYWTCFVRHFTLTMYHPIGTCKMGAVVDYNLKVIGVDGLRVVDASIMPNLPSSNPISVVYMIAEKAVDLIKQDFFGNSLPSSIMDIFLPPTSCSKEMGHVQLTCNLPYLFSAISNLYAVLSKRGGNTLIFQVLIVVKTCFLANWKAYKVFYRDFLNIRNFTVAS